MTHTANPNDYQEVIQPAAKRIASVDLLRGLVMVLMTLDHVRAFFSNAQFSPLDLTQTTLPLFLTRWVTHLCAPSFVFLAGVSAYFSLRRRNSKGQLARHLLTRGLWLLILELTIVNLAWTFDPTFSFFFTGVLWAIGWSMIVLAALIQLPTVSIGAIGLFVMVFHNLLDPIQADQLGDWNWLWAVLHQRQMFTLFQERQFFLGYPLIPWIGVMAAGYAFGSVFELPHSQRQPLLRRLGGGLIVAFVVLRMLNLYGDPNPWSVQSNFLYTLLSFINCHKYPPSLLFLLMTLGPAILLLELFERRKFKLLKPLVLFGQVPLFFYVVHLLLIHLAGCPLRSTNIRYRCNHAPLPS